MSDVSEQMKQLEAKYERLQEDVHTAENRRDAVEGEIEKLVQNTVHPLFPETDKNSLVYLISWGWKCESQDENPFLLCVYDGNEDPCLDDCLFCHEPQERK